MAGWERVKLGESCKIIAGQSPSSETYNTEGVGLPFFQGKTDFGLVSPNVRMFCSQPIKIAEPGDILISVRAPVGPTNLCNMKSCIGRGLSAIRVSENIERQYLIHFLKHHEPILAQAGVGSTFKAITQADLSTIEIPLPPLEEQKRIAAILDSADAIRTKRKAAIAKLDELAQSIFLDMFGDPVTNPKGIEVVKLKDISTKITDGVHHRPEYTDSGIPFISVKDITTGSLSFADCKYISDTDHIVFSKRCFPEYLDILYTKVGATYGRPALVDTSRPFSLYVSVCLIKPNKTLVDPYFLCATLALPALKKQADKRIKGIGVPDLHLDQIQQFQVPLPSMHRQKKYADYVVDINRLRSLQIEALSREDQLFSSLQQRAFSGEL